MVHEAAFTAMVREFVEAGERDYVFEDVLFNQGFAEYVHWLVQGERGELPGLAPWSAYWAVETESAELVGLSSLRHTLSPWLAEFGGHIGYRVRPSARRRGLGSALLSLTLQRADGRGITQALVVCTPESVGSQGVLRRNGAVFDARCAPMVSLCVATGSAPNEPSLMQAHKCSIEPTFQGELRALQPMAHFEH